MSKGPRHRARFNTGFRIRQLFYPFVKDTLQSTLRNKLHVEIKTSPAKSKEYFEILLVGCGEKPQFEEAKVLVGKTIEMTEENWEHLNQKASGEIQSIDLEDSVEEISSDDLDIAKENKKDSPRTAVVCEGSKTDQLCTVIVDTNRGPVPSNNGLPGKEFTKKENEKILLSGKESTINENSEDTSDSTSSNPTTTLGSARISGEDFIFLKSRSGKCSQNEDTIVLDDDTILISSGSESEEDILIDKVVPAKSDISKKKKKKKSIETVTQPLISNKKKRKSNESVSLGQRNSKIIKNAEHIDVASSIKAVHSSQTTLLHQKKSKTQNKSPLSKSNIPSTSTKHNYANNVISSSNAAEKKTGPRPIIIDANNVSRDGKKFHFKKLETCIKYFQDRNHKVIAFLPRHMIGVVQDREEKAKLWTLEEEKVLCFTPSRKMPDGKSMAAYDDRFIVQTATELGGVIVSNDNFRDIMSENEKWKETIEKRLLMFTWVGDMLMFPNDPLGREGPHLEEFLRFPPEGNELE